MIGIQTASRLHFGLLSLPAGKLWPNHQGQDTVPARRFGGVGLMVERPGLRLSVQPAADWSARGHLAERALVVARRFAETVPAETIQPQQLNIEGAPEHVGLGTGTQLSLAVGEALRRSWKLPPLSAVELARRVGRGQRSALGIHGFEQGGFLVEAGQSVNGGISPLVARVEFPQDWRLVLVLPAGSKGIHGHGESQFFQELLTQGADLAWTESLCRLVLLGMLPALAERDLPAFGEALHDFNRRVGDMFARAQGGPYAGMLGEIVAFVRQQGVTGVGQSSWGPTLFAVTEGGHQAAYLADRIRDRFQLRPGEVIVTAACNREPHLF
jgi:beta-RFAP synthase